MERQRSGESPLFGPSGVRSLRRFIFWPRNLRRMPYRPAQLELVAESGRVERLSQVVDSGIISGISLGEVEAR